MLEQACQGCNMYQSAEHYEVIDDVKPSYIYITPLGYLVYGPYCGPRSPCDPGLPYAHSSLIVVPVPIVVSKPPCGPKDPW